MKTFFHAVENLFVAVAFAEAGAYDSLMIEMIEPRPIRSVRVHA